MRDEDRADPGVGMISWNFWRLESIREREEERIAVVMDTGDPHG